MSIAGMHPFKVNQRQEVDSVCSIIARSQKPEARSRRAFTLSELLIAVGVLGIIGTFTIPKVLVSVRDQQANTAAKEVAAAITEIHYRKINLEGKTSAGLTPDDLKDGLQIVKNSTNSSDGTHDPGGSTGSTATGSTGFWRCSQATSAGQACVILHNGGCLQIIPFGGSGPLYQVFSFDPDNAGPLVRVNFLLDSNGRVVSAGKKGFSIGAGLDTDPDWFHWN